MNTVEKYIADVRRMFFISVDNNINEWSRSKIRRSNVNSEDIDIYKSPDFGRYNYLYVDLSMKQLKLHIDGYGNYSNTDKLICDYKFIFVCDKEVNNYVKKLKKHFMQVDQDEKDKSDIEQLKTGLDFMQKKYPLEYQKEVRKEKLETLKN